MVLEAVYEQEFLDCSHGFRPRRSAHQALEALQRQLVFMAGGWLIELDIEKFFDSVDHDHLRAILHQRMRDGVLLRLLGKWLHAGVLEAGQIHHPEAGTPQGGVVSPILANIFLHEVLDVWFERKVKPRLKGRAFMIRYADDAVLAFACEEDARRVLDVLPKRFGKYGLTLHPEKTRLVEFRRPDRRLAKAGDRQPRTFDLMGFTHFWDLSRNGKWVVKWRTARDRFRRALKRISQWCRENRHRPPADQQRALAWKLRGHYGYFGIMHNSHAIERFYVHVFLIWRKWLGRRSQRAHMSPDRMRRLVERYPLPLPRMPRSYRAA
jgi:RNA-directed DNA polymerase